MSLPKVSGKLAVFKFHDPWTFASVSTYLRI